MNRTKIIEHYKKFMQLDEMHQGYETDIDWMQSFIEDNNLVNKNDLLPVVRDIALSKIKAISIRTLSMNLKKDIKGEYERMDNALEDIWDICNNEINI